MTIDFDSFGTAQEIQAMFDGQVRRDDVWDSDDQEWYEAPDLTQEIKLLLDEKFSEVGA